MTRRVTIQTPLGPALQFRQLRGHEALSELYALDIDLVSTDKGLDPKALLGKSATVVVETDGGGRRYIDGLVSRFGLQGQDHSLYSYKLILRPWPWLATLRSDVRFFQFKSVPEIIQDVLGPYGQPFKLKLSPGYTLTLTNHPRQDQNQDYLILAVHYEFQENPQVSEGAGGSGSQQTFSLALQPKSVPYRTQRKTPKPRTHGPQTAIVVGPAGEEIWVDQYGRVKVQFHWDREGKMDENASCWVRVSTAWAGSNFGAVFTPRIGMEVIIDFLNGDPDYPILTGCVYNAANMPPWGLPDNATQSGLLTRSSKGGAPGAGQKNGAGDANAIRFEDKAGAEQLWLHAQKDQLTEVEHDEDKWVGNDRRKTVDGNETNVIHKNRTETVDQNETITVHQNRTETVDLNETITIHQNRSETVDLNETIAIGVNRSESVGANETVSIGSNRSVTIGGNKTETIALAKAETIGLAKALSIGAAYQVSVGGLMNTTVGLAQAEEVGLSQSSVVGKSRSAQIGDNDSLQVGKDQAIEVHGKRLLKVKDASATEVGGAHDLKVQKDRTVSVHGAATTAVAGKYTLSSGATLSIDGQNVKISGMSSIALSVGASTIEIGPGTISINAPLVKINC